MYEIELRALVDDFNAIKSRLDSFARQVRIGEKEATVFFFNPHQKDFDLRLRMRKNRCFLSFKEGLHKTARKEVESDISSPHAIYDMLKRAGFKIKFIIARINYAYQYGKFEILLNKITDWGNAIEVETVVDEDNNSGQIESEIKEFMKSKIGLTDLLSKERLNELNEEYMKKIDFEAVRIGDLLDYVNGKKESLKFIQ